MEVRVSENFYIPRDEIFDGQKQSDFLSDQLTSAAHNLIPAIEGLLTGGKNEFNTFKDVRNLYQNGIDIGETLQTVVDTKDQSQKMDPFEVVKKLGADDRSNVLKYTIPQVIQCKDNLFITASFHYVISASCAHSHLTTLPVKHWSITGAVRAMSHTVTHCEICLSSPEHLFPEFLT